MNRVRFVLKPSNVEGVGVFAACNLNKGEYLELFDNCEGHLQIHLSELEHSEDEQYIKRYGVMDANSEKLYIVPGDLHRMSIGWYLNHSDTPNIHHSNYDYFALRFINAGEELTMDYRTLGECSLPQFVNYNPLMHGQGECEDDILIHQPQQVKKDKG